MLQKNFSPMHKEFIKRGSVASMVKTPECGENQWPSQFLKSYDMKEKEKEVKARFFDIKIKSPKATDTKESKEMKE